MGNSAGLWILLIMLIVVVAFVIITTITGKKAAKKEKAQRYKAVRNEIKSYIAKNDQRKNIRVEFEKVYSRKGPVYKYRDVFDVVVELIEPKTQKTIERRAYEVEGITTKIDKKNYATKWIVNTILDLNETEQRIAIGQKEIVLTKEERKAIKKADKLKEKELAKIEKEEIKKIRSEAKENRKNPTIESTVKREEKFVPVRSKK